MGSHTKPYTGAWVLAEVEINSATCGAIDGYLNLWDWDLSGTTGGGYFLGLFLFQKNTATDAVLIRTNGNPTFETSSYGSMGVTQTVADLDSEETLACWIFSDANSIVEVGFDDVSDGDKVMLVGYMSFTPPQAWV